MRPKIEHVMRYLLNGVRISTEAKPSLRSKSLEWWAPSLPNGTRGMGACDLAGCVAHILEEAEKAWEPRRVFMRVSEDAYWLCGTLGAGYDVFQRARAAISSVEGFIAQAAGTAALEEYLDACEAEIRAELKDVETLKPRVSPGYGTIPLGLSREILSRLDASRRIGVVMTSADLLVPSKSVTAIVGVVRV